MENASQALMIVAGVLLGILILSLGVYLFYVFGGYVSNSTNEIAKNQIAQFNEKFLQYDQRQDLTIQDVITVKNNALNNNLRYSDYSNTYTSGNNSDGKNNFVDVFIKSGSKFQWILDDKDEELLKIALAYSQRYECEVQISEYTGRVYRIIFKEVLNF